MKILYFDCFSGISGDMTIAALVDLGIPADWLESELNKLNLKDYFLEITKTYSQEIFATKFNVKIKESKQHRNLADILEIIKNSEIPQKAKDLSEKIFTKLAQAEAKIHNKKIKEVHFHEIGAIDSIIDIVGASLCITKLAPQKIYSSAIPLPKGEISFSHGTWPLPAPATLEILKGTPCYQVNIDKEIVAPTGAAIISTIAEKFCDMPLLNISKIGYGAGTFKTKLPNVLRVIEGDAVEAKANMSDVTVIETNIDDMNPEFFEFLFEKLFSSGALDVYMTNIIMKKTRPAVKLSVLCNKQDSNIIAEIVLSNSSSIGVRIRQDKRLCLSRETKKVKTPYGEVSVKISKLNENNINVAPEYEDCKRLAQEKNVPLKEVYNAAITNFFKGSL